MRTEMKAREIAEDLLRRTGRALMQRDDAAFTSCMAVPLYIETFEGRVFCNHVAHLREIFFAVSDHFKFTGVTHLDRHCVAAEFRNADTVEATHETRLLSYGQVVQPAFPVFSVLKRINGSWKITDSMYAIVDGQAYSDALIRVSEPRATA